MDQVNCTIPLTEGPIEVFCNEYGGRWIPVPAKVTMQLSPVPRVLIAISDMPIILASDLYSWGKSLPIRMPSGPEIKAYVEHAQIGDICSSTLRLTKQPVTILQTGSDLRSVKFGLINFSSLYQEARPALIQAEPWHVEIRPLPELAGIKDELKVESGYALTHEGSIRRADEQSFSVEEARKLLDVLHLFLSFAQGGNCGVTLIRGSDEHGGRAWERWGTYATYPWFHLSSWLDYRHNNDDELCRAFPGFWRILGQTTGAPDDPVRVALYWYLRSNESNSPYSGIILTQAALERLARQLLPNVEYETLKHADKRIRQALKVSGIDPVIPQCCKELRAVAQINGLCDGPEALTKIRNDLVHAEMRANVSLEAYLEAWDLGQWYVELLFLRLFRYDGQYANRLAYNYGNIHKPEVVPWG